MGVYMVLIFVLLVFIGIFGIIYTVKSGFLQKGKDDEVNAHTAKHKIGMNIILWSYVLVLLAVIVGAYVFYQMVYS